MDNDSDKPRWQYRLDNFSRAYVLLREGMEQRSEGNLSQLAREGLIQRFEYTWELAWKTIADYLSAEGIVVSPITPRAVIRAAFEADVITRGPEWMRALDARNKMSQTYNFKIFEAVIEDISTHYLSLFEELYEKLTAEALSL
jgi:nucleotidyltransferase substrate binding protein (TIGR01987 family)